MIIPKSVNFGKGKTGLSTIGFALKNFDGSVKQARATAGITEIVSGQGIYGGNLTFEDSWSGFIIWDTGEGTPLYAIENFDYRQYASNALPFAIGGGPTVIHDSVWTAKEKERLFKTIESIINKIQSLGIPQINESIVKLRNDQDNRMEVLVSNVVSISAVLKEALNLEVGQSKLIATLQEYMEGLHEAMEALMEHQEFQELIKGVEEDVSNQIERQGQTT